MYKVHAIKYEHGSSFPVTDELTVEEILHIAINGEPYTTTMRSPGDEEELTRGILLTEDVYRDEENPTFRVMRKNEKNHITHVNVLINETRLGPGINTKRNLLSVSSCGVCGKYDMDLELSGKRIETDTPLTPEQMNAFFDCMKLHQTRFQKTGGCHASAAFDANGNLLAIHEDIGRHNAVDKVIGGLLLKHVLPQALCLLVSGRVSYEIVSKCFRAGIPYLAAVSAPSSMAVDYCREKGIQLFAFCRENKMTKYS